MTHAPTRSHRSVTSRGIELFSRIVVRPQVDGLPLHGSQLRYLRRLLKVGMIVAGRCEPCEVVKVSDPNVRGEWIRRPDSAPLGQGAVLYLHGGGYVASSARAYRSVASFLAEGTGVQVFAADYRLAPKHQFPAALDDALSAYALLVDAGCPPDRIVVAGDSAGGHLAVGLLISLIEAGCEPPAGMVLFSPLLDPSCATARREDAVHPDPMLSPAFADRCAVAYLGDNDVTDPRISPLEAMDSTLAGFPPVLSYVGSTECFRGDAVALHDRLDDQGVPNEIYVVPGQIHSFITLNRLVPEAREVLRETSRFVRECLAASAPRSARQPIRSFAQEGA